MLLFRQLPITFFVLQYPLYLAPSAKIGPANGPPDIGPFLLISSCCLIAWPWGQYPACIALVCQTVCRPFAGAQFALGMFLCCVRNKANI